MGILIGSKEIDSPLLNQQLSSGGLTWSGNARPIPQVWIGLPEYVQVLPRLALKAEMSYGWFTDNKYQRKQVGEDYWYTKSIKYHHKSGFLRIGVPQGKWQLDLGMSLDVQFGGYKSAGMDAGDLGNSWKDYFKVFIPSRGDDSSPEGEQIAYQGNFMGSEHIRMTYRHEDFPSALIWRIITMISVEWENSTDLMVYGGLNTNLTTNRPSTVLYWNTIRLLIRAVQCMEWISL